MGVIFMLLVPFLFYFLGVGKYYIFMYLERKVSDRVIIE